MNDYDADHHDPRERERHDDLFAVDKALNRLLMDGFHRPGHVRRGMGASARRIGLEP
ncbi:hypothetical protein [Bifidobacterium crudilactis]|uniref:hypothetical protein n=1 Tax=Bifidobacterium crudilactis TaxID=327277 RepID=UPI002648B39D|nr:hypothetical protein [Bifidobacterium crudilactis]MDN6467714.1 hypothetical protein [Bifidobacterium crudilactis]MDN6558721.1 hypothetical protein [Bifidobacterium crudilactis]MDN6772650.1 hypothetical protein [Bifidobacterium crudilactis]MDN6804718.1 hypothetical protein [Bifidobacterium crudilactis]MDN6816520.1 hypothetical protein [Bifidobacterium crudilactis]